MRKKLWTALLAIVATTALAAADTQELGEALSGDLEPTPIADILADPESWIGRRVLIEGEISGVCAHQGCWMDLSSPDDATLRVKVEDGVIVFPSDAVGATATAEGEVELLKLDRDQWLARLRHLAEEADQPFDPEAVGDGPYEVVRLRGLGARIEAP